MQAVWGPTEESRLSKLTIDSSFNPIDPNPAVAVFPQSGRSRPEKSAVFPHFFQKRTLQKVFTACRGPIYQNNGSEMLLQIQKKWSRFDK